MRWFIIKVKASDCPNGIAQPSNTAVWEGRIFNTGVPQQSSKHKDISPDQSRNPDPGDHVLIWVNGSGLMAIAMARDFVDRTTEVQNVELLPNPRLDDTDLDKDSAIAAIRDLAISRRVKLRPLTNEDSYAIRHAAQLKIAKEDRSKSHISGGEGKRRHAKSERLERRSKLARLAKDRNKQEHYGIYTCEVCNFWVDEAALLDAHHLFPLSLGERQTRVQDFAVLCPTCHRLAHHQGPTQYSPLTPQEIQRWWSERKSTDPGDRTEATGRTE
jgi:5-methylcytosine-specific restriction endonuclease McrA